MEKSILVRLVVPSDKDQFAALMNNFIQEYVQIEKTYPVHYDSQIGSAYWQDIVDPNTHHVAVVAELEGGQLVGFCVGQIKTSEGAERVYADNELQGCIWDVAVDPAFRNKGIGKLMIDKITQEFAARGCRDMVINGVDVTNTGAQKLYDRLGFKVWNIRYYKKIG